MDARDERLDPVRSFTLTSFRLEEERWLQFVSEEETQVIFSTFFNTPDYKNLFLCQDPEDGGLSVDLDPPKNVQTKVICVSRSGREVITRENVRKILIIQEVEGEDAKSFIIAVSEEVTCPLLINPETSRRWVVGLAEEALRSTEQQRNEALVMEAQMEGGTFLTYPDALHEDQLHGNTFTDDTEEGKLSHTKLLYSCDTTITEWVKLVSDFLQQDSSQPVLDGLDPLPSEEFNFWRTRLKNLHLIQQQLRSSRAQQVVSVVQRADSVYWSSLRDLYSEVQEGLDEAQDLTVNLDSVQEKLEELEQMDYQQSRRFLHEEEVMSGLGSDSGPRLDDVTLVIWTLQTLKEEYRRCRTQLEQDGDTHNWDFPSNLVFFNLDHFLLHLQSIQEVFSVSLKLHKLDSAVLSGVGGRMWTDVVQQVYQDFLGHVIVLCDSTCDPTDPEDQSFQLHLNHFWFQVSDLERRLVSVLSRAFEDCCTSSSGAKLVKMFGFLLDRPLIQDQLRPHLTRLEELVLEELDQTEVLFYSEREEPNAFSRFTPSAAAGLCWTQQLRLRAENSLDHYRTLQQLDLDSGASQLVLQRFQQIVDLLQDFTDRVRSSWSSLLDSDCEFILKQPLIQNNLPGMLGVNCSHTIQGLLKELRYVSRKSDVELRPHAARLFTCRDDITQSCLSLSHMVSCYQQVASDVLPVELPLIRDQLQDLNQNLLELQGYTWNSEGVQQLVEQKRERLLLVHSSVSRARANMAAVTRVTQEWAELHLLQCSGDSLLEVSDTEQTYRRIREEGEEVLRLTQVNRSLYGAEVSSESWIRYLDHIDDQVQDGLFQLVLRSLTVLLDNMNPQSCSVFLTVSLQLQETGSVFEPSVGDGLSDLLQSVYSAASLPLRVSERRHGNYQVSLQQSPDLSALEQEVMHRLLQVKEEAERLSAGLDRYAYLWQSDRREVMQEFLTYSRQLGDEEVEVEEALPTLKDFQREIESLHRLSREVTHLDDVIVLHSWLQVDLRTFKDSLLSVVHEWKHLYTEYLLDSVRDSLQQVTHHRDDDEESSPSSSFPLTETIFLLEAAGVELPEHLSAQLELIT
ncbi:dynein axonemal heavy chain 17-like isoform X2 [Cebidichthys violaceus]|uniref:dynein axonemal heavy chain 17-like isoform X2 n=1 Tax=Cebidichthys violaceus TaxID=271503 RepID=UPI0035CC0EC4